MPGYGDCRITLGYSVSILLVRMCILTKSFINQMPYDPTVFVFLCRICACLLSKFVFVRNAQRQIS